MKIVRDPRLYKAPKVKCSGDQYVIQCKALSPDQLDLIQILVLMPLSLLWRVSLLVVMVDALLWFFVGWTIFFYASIDRASAYWGVGLFYVLWHIDQWSRYAIWNSLLGHSVRVELTPEEVRVCRGWFYSKSEPRIYPISFRLVDLREEGKGLNFQEAKRLNLVLDAKGQSLIANIADPVVATRLHANLVTTLEIMDARNEFDVDPTRKQRF